MPEQPLILADLGLELKPIAPGAFRRPGRNPDGTPATWSVTLSRAYWLAATPVTQGQYARVMNSRPSYFEGDALPVESVSWHDALEFCQRLTAVARQAGHIRPDHAFRLPSEAEWEYACRAGCADPLPVRDESGFPLDGDPERLLACAWFEANAEAHTHPVAERQANAWGLHDLLGNVGEWCLDWHAPLPDADVTDPVGPDGGERRVRRGGAWDSVPRRCRAADRLGVAPETRCGLIGFRIVLAPAAPGEPAALLAW
jgi:formylglycine-generating enzyme required for sulfatase activity